MPQLPPELVAAWGRVTRRCPRNAQHKETVHPGVTPGGAEAAAFRSLTAKRFPQLSLPQHPQQSLFFRPKNTRAGKIICQREKHLRRGLTREGRACAARLCAEPRP